MICYIIAANCPLLNKAYDALLITGVAVGVSMVGKKVLGMSLGTPETLKSVVKLAHC